MMANNGDFPSELEEVLKCASIRLCDNINAWHWPNAGSDSPMTETNVVAEIYSSFRESFESTRAYFEATTTRNEKRGRVDLLLQAGDNAYAIEVKTVGSLQNYARAHAQLATIKNFCPLFTPLELLDERDDGKKQIITPEVWHGKQRWVLLALLVFGSSKVNKDEDLQGIDGRFDIHDAWMCDTSDTRHNLRLISRRSYAWHDGFADLKGFFESEGARRAYRLTIDQRWKKNVACDKKGKPMTAGDAFLLVGIRAIND